MLERFIIEIGRVFETTDLLQFIKLLKDGAEFLKAHSADFDMSQNH